MFATGELALRADQEQFRTALRAWLEAHAPRDPEPEDPGEAFRRARRWQGELARAGYVGVDWPVEHGGRGLGLVERFVVEAELARVRAPMIAGIIGVSNIGPAIMAFGTPEQQRRHLERVRTGDEIWCQGMSESEAGSDIASLRTRAERDGDAFVVDGHNIWCSNASEADWCQLYVRTGAQSTKHGGITCLLVDMRTPGIEVRPIRMITGHSSFGEIFFDGVRVPLESVLGEVDQGWRVAIETLTKERLGAVALLLPIQQTMDDVLALARTSARVASSGALRQRVAAAYAEVSVLRALCLRMLVQVDRGGAGALGSLIKLSASGLRQRLAELGLDLVSSNAVPEGDWPQQFLASRSATIEAGTSEIQRNIVAERLLGMPKG